VTSSSWIPPLIEEEAQFQNTSLLEKKNMIMGPSGAQNQAFCAGEGQQNLNELGKHCEPDML
jgi:hypothetical protein